MFSAVADVVVWGAAVVSYDVASVVVNVVGLFVLLFVACD